MNIDPKTGAAAPMADVKIMEDAKAANPLPSACGNGDANNGGAAADSPVKVRAGTSARISASRKM